MDLVFPQRVACKSGAEVDAVEHRRDLAWDDGERASIKRAMRRRDRRETRRTLRMTY